MQELIDWAISLQYNQQQCIDWIVIKEKAESLFEMEKQQIMEAYMKAKLEHIDTLGLNSKKNQIINDTQQYYTQTFKKD